jgi:CRP-like cAMP-binding protein
MSAATKRSMTRGEVIIRQGDEADNFYVIVEGTVEVTQTRPDGTGARVLREMGRGQFFGEIGLLSGVPRTATVTAMRDGMLVVLGRDAFLELVSAGSGLTYRLLDLHRGAITAGGGEARPATRAGDA